MGCMSRYPVTLKNIYYFPDGGSFNDVVGVEELVSHRQE